MILSSAHVPQFVACATNCFFCFVFYFLRPDENGLPFHEITGSTSTLSLSTMVWKNCQVNRRQTRKRNQHAILYTLKKRKASADIQFQHKSFWNIIFTCIFIWDRQKKKKKKRERAQHITGARAKKDKFKAQTSRQRKMFVLIPAFHFLFFTFTLLETNLLE